MTAAIRRREIEERQPLKAGRVSVQKIRFRVGNRNLGDLRDLAASLKQDGVLLPIVVHRIGDVFEVLDGHRRLAAAMLAGLRTVPVIVVPRRSKADAIAIMVATALYAKALEPHERANAINELIQQHGWTIAALAERWGVSTSTVQRWRIAAVPDADAADTAGTALSLPSSSTPRTTSPKPRRPARTVGARKLADVVTRWEEKCGPNGLDQAAASAFFTELRGLLPHTSEQVA